MAVVDIPGFVADLKDHATEHGFHVHDERHFVETYSMRQAWEGRPPPRTRLWRTVGIFTLAVELDPRTLLTFEDQILDLSEDVEPPEGVLVPPDVYLGSPTIEPRP